LKCTKAIMFVQQGDIPMNRALAGKVALVSGGSRGIGAATAKALADHGADVTISYAAAAEKAEAVVRDLQSKGVRAAAFKADRGDPAQVEKLIGDVAAKFGRLDMLVNNAGLFTDGTVDATLDTSAFDRQQAVNVTGVIAGIRTASRIMGDGGRIISMSSGVPTRVGGPGMRTTPPPRRLSKGGAPQTNRCSECPLWVTSGPHRGRSGTSALGLEPDLER